MKKLLYFSLILITTFSLYCKGNLFNEGLDSPEEDLNNDNNPPGNNIPVAENKSITVSMNIQASIILAASDADGNTLTWHIDTSPDHGALSGTAPNLTYTPDTNYTGSDSFTFHVNDGYVNSNTATVSITIQNLATTVTWTEVDMGIASTVNMGKIAIGKARGDNISRVYAGVEENSDGDIIEFTYSAPDTWDKQSVVDGLTDLYEIVGIAVLDMGNGMNIYAGGHGFAEYKFNGSVWTGGEKDIPVENGVQWTNGLKFGQGKNDGITRAYIADWERIVEVSYDYGDWNGIVIETSNNVCDLVVAQGQNNGTYRLYAILGTFYGTIWEYTWNGSAWILAECSDQAASTSDFILITGGNGRNDGVIRLYAWGMSGLYEFSYDSAEGWSYVVITSVSFGVGSTGDMVLADGRNDGFIRLYTADDNGVGEYTFAGTWQKTGLITSQASGGVNIGNGRNDTIPVNRVYATSGTHVYEYTAETK